MTEQNEVIDPATLEPIAEEGPDPSQTPAKKQLQPCPCGKVPATLILEVQERGKYGRTLGDCCGDWSVEFRNGYTNDQEETAKRAASAWNTAQRSI